ncbi:MAG: hypothetical protein E7Z91_05865 [Cyanobacteria bacterium SIG30]|nr:hypothetical protein [Cyanobacteria bacterium SIG30]
MKIVFYDIKEIEKEFYRTNCPSELEIIFTSSSLNKETINKEELEAEMISGFIGSNFSKEILKKFKNLKYVFLRSVGYDHVDTEYCKKREIRVFNTPRYGDWTIAEYAFGLLLSIVRKIMEANSAVKNGSVNPDDFMGLELHSKTLGIIGLGKIGERVAQIGKGFNMKIIFYDIKDNPDYKKVDFDSLCKMSDFIIITCPLTDKTKYLFNKDKFKIMKNEATIINIARGEIIKTEDLLNALENKKINFAGLDVIECEYITNNINKKDFCLECNSENCLKKYITNQKLLKNKKVIVTPHIAYNTKEAMQRIMQMTISNIKCAMNKKCEVKNENIVI